jgi:hypothetical protein
VDSQHQLLQTIDPKLCAKPDESVNGYAIQEAIGMIATIPTELRSTPLDVSEFAAQNSLNSLLRPILTTTQEVFHGCSMSLRVEEDAEVESEHHLVIEVDVTGWSAQEMFSARNRWSQQFLRVCPSESSTIFQIRLVQNP